MELFEETLGKNSFSKEEFDSNAEILPAKKKNKRTKQSNQTPEATKTQCLSKSQKRKLKKMEEEKEKALIYSKSIEMLEKYKLPEDAYSLMRSSKSIGKAETFLEKRRRVVQFSKAGFVIPNPREYESLKQSEDEDIMAGEQEDCTIDNDHMQIVEAQQETAKGTTSSVHFSQQPVDTYDIGSTGGACVAMVTEDVSENLRSSSARADNGNSATTCPSSDCAKNTNRMDGVEESGEKDTRKNINMTYSSSPKSRVAPCVVHVARPNEVEEQRKDLPIVMMEQEIMETINYNSTVIICGETGCGKTTQVPQFLYEAGFGSKQFSTRSGIIGVTQPRKVAVLATAKRVAFELGFRLGKEVGFQVRHDKKIGESSSIKCMTDGILLREVQNDMLLRRYSVIILDEAHERSLNTDILIGMLSRVIRVRQHCYEQQQKLLRSGQSIKPDDVIFPLKLVLMSATLRVEDFTSSRKLFDVPPPVINIPTRQYKVTVHFSKKTEIVDYLGPAYKKVISIHKNLPQGGILVFVTGQREVEFLCQKLRKASKDMIKQSSKRDATNEVIYQNGPEMSSVGGVDMEEINEAFDESSHGENDGLHSSEADLSEREDDDDNYDSSSESEWETIDENDNLVDELGENGNLDSLKAAFEALAGKSGINPNSDGKLDSCVTKQGSSLQPIPCTEVRMEEHKDKGPGVVALRVLPLYAMLPAAAQLHVFEEVKENERLVVVATNVAETSLTIPGIKYVVDTGREKVKNYNPSNGIETYDIQWISKASASQRAGRAGRTGPGHCYRLYSSAVFNNIFPDFSCAEISKVPVDGVVLLLKSMCISKVTNFPFPTPPESSAMVEADRCLKALEALDPDGNLTTLGKAMAYYPMSPRHSRMLLTVIQIMREVNGYARANLVLGYAVATAAALSMPNPFIMRFEGSQTDKDEDEIREDEDKLQKKKLKEKIKEARNKFSNPSSDALTAAYALQRFEQSEMQTAFCEDNGLHLKTMEEMSKLRKQLLQLVFNRNRNLDNHQDFSWPHGNLLDVENSWQGSSGEIRLTRNKGLDEENVLGQAICAGWADRVARRTHAKKYQSCVVQEPVFLHRWSSLFNYAPEFLVYSELLLTRRPYMNGATTVKPEWLVKYSSSLCTFSTPLEDPKPYYDAKEDKVFHWVSPTFGSHLWQLPLHNVHIPDDSRRVAVFAACLLDGEVLPCLRAVRGVMAAKPETILKPEGLGHARVGNLLKEMKSKKIDSCSELSKQWDRDPKTLYSEVMVWFQKKFHDQFELLWSEMLREAKLQPYQRFPKRIKRGKHAP